MPVAAGPGVELDVTAPVADAGPPPDPPRDPSRPPRGLRGLPLPAEAAGPVSSPWPASPEAATAEPEHGDESGPAASAGTGGPRGPRGGRGGSRAGSGGGSASSTGGVTSSSTPGPAATGTLASDEALAALREKLSGGQS